MQERSFLKRSGLKTFLRQRMQPTHLFSCGAAWKAWEKPQLLLQRVPSDVQKERLWEYCTVCGKYRPMKEMYALLLRRKRGDSPERVAYMCPECYEQFSRDNFEKGKDDEV